MAGIDADSRAPTNRSVGGVQAYPYLGIRRGRGRREWKEAWREQLSRWTSLRARGRSSSDAHRQDSRSSSSTGFSDDAGKESTMTNRGLGDRCASIATAWQRPKGDEDVAVEKVRKSTDEFWAEGTLPVSWNHLGHHRARHSNPFTIVGVFYHRAVLRWRSCSVPSDAGKPGFFLAKGSGRGTSGHAACCRRARCLTFPR